MTWIRALEATAPSPWSPLNSSPNQRRKLGLNAPDIPNTTGTFQHIFYVVSASQAINGQMKKWLEASEEMARRQWSNFMLYGSFLVKSSRPYALDSNGRGCRCLELPETVLYCSSNQKSKYTIAIVALVNFFFQPMDTVLVVLVRNARSRLLPFQRCFTGGRLFVPEPGPSLSSLE